MAEIGQEDLRFAVTYSRRRTLQIVVNRDGSVRVKAPCDISERMVRAKVLMQAEWIRKKQDYFKKLGPKPPPSQYISGETHYYLGDPYTLRIVEARYNQVVLLGPVLQISINTTASEKARRLLAAWYAEQAATQFATIYARCWTAFVDLGYPRPIMRIKQMRSRWGSMSSSGKMSINLELIKMPTKCVEYVVMHELCHLRHPNHSKQFYAFLQQQMPDWAEREKKLKQTARRIISPSP